MTAGIKANADGSAAIQVGGSDAITITSGLNTTFAGTVTSASTVAGATGTLYPLVRGTSVASTSGTSIDFTGIPSWVDRITIMLDGVSTNGISPLMFQLGSTTFTTTGYKGTSTFMGPTTLSSVVNNTGFFLTNWVSAANDGYGSIVFTNITGNSWVAAGNISTLTSAVNWVVSGSIALSGTLDRVRITTVGGANTFDAGTINILYE